MAGKSAGQPEDPAPSEERARYLRQLGDRVREARTRRGMTRKILARDSQVSERYLAQLEAGQGNISILLLRELARALDLPLATLIGEGPEPPVDLVHTIEFLRRLRGPDLGEAHKLLVGHFGGSEVDARRQRIGLVGLRGAGKSTLGARLAERLAVPFIELDREIESESGQPLSGIFDLYGQPGFRRFERQCLDKVIAQHPRFVLATGGGIVSEPATFERLLNACFTVWVKAAPSEHMQRVVAQGDMRPMTDNREAMADLQRILSVREPLYRKADAAIDTQGKSIEESLEELVKALPSLQA